MYLPRRLEVSRFTFQCWAITAIVVNLPDVRVKAKAKVPPNRHGADPCDCGTDASNLIECDYRHMFNIHSGM